MDWEQHYLEEHTPWDKGAAAPPLLEWIEANPDTISGRVLVPGCGLGHDCRTLVSLTGAEEIVGIDISAEAVKRAGQEKEAGAIRYEVADLFQLEPKHLQTYDWIWEHTCFCAIEPEMRDAYVEAVQGALKPGGNLLAVFYLDPYDEEHPRGGGPPHGCSLEELEERFVKSGRFEELESYLPKKAYEGREGLERVIRYRRLG